MPRTGDKPKQTGRKPRADGNAKRLEALDLERLAQAFRAWAGKAARPADAQSRRRVWLVFLLLRYTGAKLGEVLGLDDRRDLDLTRGVVRFGGRRKGATVREVQLPAEVAREIFAALEDPALLGLRGSLLRMDQGFVRRKFAERARECGLGKALANPSALRRARGIELLQSGVPLTIVQEWLGHSTADLTASYLDFSADDRKRIVDRFIQEEARRKTSARNMFFGAVASVRRGDLLAEVEVVTPAGFRIVSVVTGDSLERLALDIGAPVTALVKAPWVIIGRGGSEPASSARNRFQGTVVRIAQDAIAAEVIVELADGTHVCAVLTRQSVERLDLKLGEPAWVLFKAFSVILNVD